MHSGPHCRDISGLFRCEGFFEDGVNGLQDVHKVKCFFYDA